MLFSNFVCEKCLGILDKSDETKVSTSSDDDSSCDEKPLKEKLKHPALIKAVLHIDVLDVNKEKILTHRDNHKLKRIQSVL